MRTNHVSETTLLNIGSDDFFILTRLNISNADIIRLFIWVKHQENEEIHLAKLKEKEEYQEEKEEYQEAKTVGIYDPYLKVFRKCTFSDEENLKEILDRACFLGLYEYVNGSLLTLEIISRLSAVKNGSEYILDFQVKDSMEQLGFELVVNARAEYEAKM